MNESSSRTVEGKAEIETQEFTHVHEKEKKNETQSRPIYPI